jgi:hypothetical protein
MAKKRWARSGKEKLKKRERPKKRIPMPPPPLEKRKVMKKTHKEKHAPRQKHTPRQPKKEKPVLEKKYKEKNSIEEYDSLKSENSDGFFLETNIDKLCELIEKKERIGVKEASKIFKVPEDKIEEWGKHLEKHGLLEIVYPTFGKPFLKKGEIACKDSDKKNKKKASK